MSAGRKLRKPWIGREGEDAPAMGEEGFLRLLRQALAGWMLRDPGALHQTLEEIRKRQGQQNRARRLAKAKQEATERRNREVAEFALQRARMRDELDTAPALTDDVLRSWKNKWGKAPEHDTLTRILREQRVFETLRYR